MARRLPNIPSGSKHFYRVEGEVFDTRSDDSRYDMIFRYTCELFKRNIVNTIMIAFYIYEHLVEIPVEDAMLYEMIRNIDHNLLWTNMEFMDKFRERLIHYGLYYNKVL